MKRFVFALDLVDDREATCEYEARHRADQPFPRSIQQEGRCSMPIRG